MDEANDRQGKVERPEGRDNLTPGEPVGGQILIYRDGSLNFQMPLDGQTVWLTQAGMAELYQTTPQNITLHIKAIYEEGELEEGIPGTPYQLELGDILLIELDIAPLNRFEFPEQHRATDIRPRRSCRYSRFGFPSPGGRRHGRRLLLLLAAEEVFETFGGALGAVTVAF
jgi:hypothetical protein